MKKLLKYMVFTTVLTCIASQASTAEEATHWGYIGEDGPAHWAELSPNYATCTEGKSQSPISIGFSQPTQMRPPQFRYRASSLELINNGHTIQANVESGSWLHLDGRKYELEQFHFHTPSEHETFGRQLPMEIHFVHRSPQGDLAVVGVMARTSYRQHSSLERIWPHLPKEPGDTNNAGGQRHNPISLLPMKHDFVTYQGSLTTPPCSEGVLWLVMQTPLRVSNRQIEQFTNIVGENARPVQPLNERKVLKRR